MYLPPEIEYNVLICAKNEGDKFFEDQKTSYLCFSYWKNKPKYDEVINKSKKVFAPMTRKKWGQDPKNRYALNQSKHKKHVSLREGKVSPFTMQLLPLIEFWEQKE